MRIRVILSLIVVAALAAGLAACDDDSTSGGTATAPAVPEAYADALRAAGASVGDLADAVTSGGEPEQVSASITAALEGWEDAVTRAAQADLSDPGLAGDRDRLVAASPDFAAAWTSTAEAWGSGGAVGLIELLRQRSGIAGGLGALSDAVDGALRVAGDRLRNELVAVADQVVAALERIEAGR